MHSYKRRLEKHFLLIYETLLRFDFQLPPLVKKTEEISMKGVILNKTFFWRWDIIRDIRFCFQNVHLLSLFFGTEWFFGTWNLSKRSKSKITKSSLNILWKYNSTLDWKINVTKIFLIVKLKGLVRALLEDNENPRFSYDVI